MRDHFRREAILNLLWPLLILIIGLVAAMVVPILLQHRRG
jgi:hypothetical protein